MTGKRWETDRQADKEREDEALLSFCLVLIFSLSFFPSFFLSYLSLFLSLPFSSFHSLCDSLFLFLPIFLSLSLSSACFLSLPSHSPLSFFLASLSFFLGWYRGRYRDTERYVSVGALRRGSLGSLLGKTLAHSFAFGLLSLLPLSLALSGLQVFRLRSPAAFRRHFPVASRHQHRLADVSAADWGLFKASGTLHSRILTTQPQFTHHRHSNRAVFINQ